MYRILRNLAEENLADAQRGEDGEFLYRLRTTTGHRHYLVCRRCGSAVGFTVGDIEHICVRRFVVIIHGVLTKAATTVATSVLGVAA